ncbi:uncharacterized protein [Medicago truncatula]|uniref:uncharacterized protein n=1 Tax=Medicago truncatula TaxID=3880 RepID=UPI0019675E3F|nr:uncharacterized protein LOC25482362 [Medicago truncatula]
MAVAATDFYLPNDCWESVFKFLIDDNDINNGFYFKSLSVVSKQFLSITNGLLFSFAVSSGSESTRLLPSRLFQRFTNLTSLDLTWYRGNLNELLSQVSCFPLKLTSLNLSHQSYIPADGLRAFSVKITTLTSLICSNIRIFNSNDLFLIAECFPLLEILDLNGPLFCIDGCNSILHGVETLSLAFSRLRKINLSRHDYLNNHLLFHLFKNCNLLEETIISNCDFGRMSVENSKSFKDIGVSPQLKSLDLGHNQCLRDKNIIMFASIFPNLQLLDLRHCCNISKRARGVELVMYKKVNDETLYVISKNCRGLLCLLLKDSYGVTNNGVKRVVENCTQLEEIDLRGCYKVHRSVVSSMVSSRPSLRKIIALFE